MLDDLTDDVVETQERMNFVMERMSRLLKTKGALPMSLALARSLLLTAHCVTDCHFVDKCQLGLIIFLVFVLVVMVFLVIYT